MAIDGQTMSFTGLVNNESNARMSSERDGECGGMHCIEQGDQETLDADSGGMGSDGMQIYLREIGRYPLLTSQDEQRLGQCLINARAERQKPMEQQRFQIIEQADEAVQRLVESNLRLVVSIAKRYKPRILSLLDLIQDGNLGLMHAAEKFDSSKGYRFSTYATWWIRQAVLRGLADKDRMIRIPVYLVDTLQRLLRISERLVYDLGREPSEQEIADAMNLSCKKVRELLKIGEPVSLHMTVGADYDEVELGDFIIDTQADTPDEATRNVLTEQIRTVLDTLSVREQTVLTLRFGLADGRSQTLEEVGKQLHVTRERIRQIEARAIRKLRHSHRISMFKDALG